MYALTPDPMTGTVLGHYRIRSRLGQGGMGSVYLGERIDAEYQQRVAIKVAHGLTAGPGMLERFRRERQLLAALDHPNIVRLIDGGSTPSGAPYLVMDCVIGREITDYCRENCTPLHLRVSLIRKVCAAIHYAHQRMVIHRDIKPSNILVTNDGEPKLLDFGIAKFANPSGDGELTRPDDRPMTLRYASPEQVRGESVTVASDIYALGTLFYELLAGKGPFDDGALNDAALSWRICNVEPPPIAHLPTDLHAIAAKALRKEPEHRYLSAGHFAEDLSRYLDGLPVAAARGTVLYKLGKFVRREKAAAAATASAVLILLGGAGAVMWQAGVAHREREIAERRFQDLRGLSGSVLFEVHDAVERLPGALPARRLIIERALQYLDRLNADSMSDRALTLDLIAGYHRVGFLQRSRTLENIGDTEGALATFNKAVKLGEALLERFPADSDVRNSLAESYRGLGDQYFVRGQGDTALSYYLKALPLVEGNPELRRTEMKLCGVIGAMMIQQGDAAAAGPYFEKGLAIAEASFAKDPSSAHYERDRAVSYYHLAHQRAAAGDLDGATAYNNRAIEVLLESAQKRPGDARLQRDLFVQYSRRGGILEKKNDRAGALAAYRLALARIQPVAAADTGNVQARTDLAAAWLHMANAHFELKQWADAAAAARAGIPGAEASRRADPKAAEPAVILTELYLALGDALEQSRLAVQAPGWYAKAIEVAESFAAQNPSARAFRLAADTCEAMGDHRKRNGRGKETESWYAKADAFRRRGKEGAKPTPTVTAQVRKDAK